MSDELDNQRKRQSMPVLKPKPAKDKVDTALEQAQRMRIPPDVVREARELMLEEVQETPKNPFAVVTQMVANLLK